MKRMVFVACAVASAAFAADPQGAAADTTGASVTNNIVSFTANLHTEARDGAGTAAGFDLLASYDRLLFGPALGLYAGPRIGWYSETVASAYMGGQMTMRQKPSVGAQLYFTLPMALIRQLAWLAGFAVDLLLNFDAEHQSAGEPVYLFASALLGLRLELTPRFDLELRAEAGEFPFFDSPPIFLKLGLRVGFHF